MNAHHFSAILFCIFVFAGCQQNVYELELTPDGERMHRKLVCYRVEGRNDALVTFPKEELKRIRALYPEGETSPVKRKHAFEGSFKRNTPEDIGGAGYYLTFDTPMGGLSCYAERFRGTDDMAGLVQNGLEGMDWLVDRCVEWLGREFAEEPWWMAAKDLIQFELRMDAKNLLLFLWMQSWDDASLNPPEEGHETGKEIVARILLYLAERDYFEPDEVPWLVRVIASGLPADQSGEPAKPWRDEDGLRFLLGEIISRKLDVDNTGEVVEALMRFFEREDIEKSWEESIKSTIEWKERAELWEMEKLDRPDAEEPTLETFMEEHLRDVLAMVLPFVTSNGSPPDSDSGQIAIQLMSPVEPAGTNGTWNEEEQRVEWSGVFHPSQAPPAFAYAVWVEPDEGFQVEHFGQVVLDGMKLAQYVAWYDTLSEEEARDWDTFIASLSPGDDLLDKINNPPDGARILTSWSRQILREILKTD
jgi:hypothetical protein